MNVRRLPIIILMGTLLAGCASFFGPSVKPGVELANAGDHDGALAYYQSIIATGKVTPEIYRKAYVEAFQLEKFSLADQLFAEAIGTGNEVDSMQTLALRLWYQRALTAMSNEHWITTQTATDKISSMANESRQAKFCQHMLAGKTLYDKGSTKQLWDAIGEFGRAANLNTKSGLPYLWMGRTRYKNDRTNYDAALKEYDRALSLEPNAPFAKAAKVEADNIKAVKLKMKKFWGN